MYFMMYSYKLQKHKSPQSKIFLNLRTKFRSYRSAMITDEAVAKTKTSLTSKLFKKQYTTLLKILTIFDCIQFLNLIVLVKNDAYIPIIINYYAKLTNNSNLVISSNYVAFSTYNVNNFIVLSKPKKQLFLLIFKTKPIFIFTGGLMRIVINEKRKSNKKLYKVAVSLIKLVSILILKKHYIEDFVLKLINIGGLRSKILKSFNTTKIKSKIKYLIVKIPFNPNAQKLSTRRAIKKYVKKRYKIN